MCCQNHKISWSKHFKNVYNLDETLPKYDDTHYYDSEKFYVNLDKKNNQIDRLLSERYWTFRWEFYGKYLFFIWLFFLLIVFWCWILTYIYSKIYPKHILSYKQSWVLLWIPLGLYAPYIYSFFSFFVLLFIFVFSASLGLAEKRVRFSLGCSLFCSRIFQIFFLNYWTVSLYIIIMSHTSFTVNPHSLAFLNVKELLARRRRHIWSLSDSNGIRTHNHLVRKRTLNHLAKLFTN